MSDLPRHQRRQLEREQMRLGRALIGKGLPASPRSEQMTLVARVLQHKLKEHGNPRRASEAATLAHELIERSLATYPAQVTIACSKGCHYCCASYVSVMAPEAFRLGAAVRRAGGGPLAIRDVLDRCQPLKGKPPSARLSAKLLCPLLVDGACGVYRDRPGMCRQATSLALPPCIQEFENTGGGEQIEVSAAHLAHTSNASLALLAALTAVALPDTSYELASALEIALTVPDAESRWLEGEDVFAGADRAPQRPMVFARAAHSIASALNATAGDTGVS